MLQRNRQNNTMYTRPDDVLGDWVRGINERKINRVLELYDVSCTFLPTFSPHLHNTQNEITSYFKKFISRPNVNVSLRLETMKTQHLGASIFSLTGIYDVQFDVEGKPVSFGSRFTFVIDISKPRPIQHHHSSLIPRLLELGRQAGE